MASGDAAATGAFGHNSNVLTPSVSLTPSNSIARAWTRSSPVAMSGMT
jgi:hypothetical protein